MNAIEMAITAALARALTGLEDRLPELLANLPPDIMNGARQTFANVAGLKAQLDRIENQQRLILEHLKIPDDSILTAEKNDGRSEQPEQRAVEQG